MREYFSTTRRHVSQSNVFNWPDVQLYTRMFWLLKREKKKIDQKRAVYHWIVFDCGQRKRNSQEKKCIVRFEIAEPSGCYHHIAYNVNGYNVKNKTIVTHDAAQRSASNFHNDSRYAVNIIHPSGKRFFQWTRHYRRSHNCYRQFVMVFAGHLLSHRFGDCVSIRMLTLNIRSKLFLFIFLFVQFHNTKLEIFIREDKKKQRQQIDFILANEWQFLQLNPQAMHRHIWWMYSNRMPLLVDTPVRPPLSALDLCMPSKHVWLFEDFAFVSINPTVACCPTYSCWPLLLYSDQSERWPPNETQYSHFPWAFEDQCLKRQYLLSKCHRQWK